MQLTACYHNYKILKVIYKFWYPKHVIRYENIIYQHRNNLVEKMLDTYTIHAIQRIKFNITEHNQHKALYRVAGTAH